MEQSVLLLLYLFTCPLECSCIHTHNRNGLLLFNFLSSCPVGSTALPSVRHHRRRVFYGRENLRAIVVDGSWASCHGLGLHVKISQNKSNSRRKEPFGGCGWMWMCTLYLQSHTNGPAITLFTHCRSVGRWVVGASE